MEQKNKELLLKDLCGRLPYGVKIRTSRTHGLIRIKNCVLDCHWLTEARNDFYTIKPYLFPLSNMTEEQKIIYGDLCYQIINATPFEIQNCFDELYDWLNKNHLDYRGLIEKGLAIDATGLNIY